MDLSSHIKQLQNVLHGLRYANVSDLHEVLVEDIILELREMADLLEEGTEPIPDPVPEPDPVPVPEPPARLTPLSDIRDYAPTGLDLSWMDNLPTYPDLTPRPEDVVLKVGPTEQYTRISDALEVAPAHAYIMVAPGAYPVEFSNDTPFTALEITKPVRIIVEDGQEAVVRGTNSVTYGVIINSTDVVLKGIRLENFSSVGFMAGYGSGRITLIDCATTDVAEAFALWDDTWTLSNVLLYQCDFGYQNVGIHCGNGTGTFWRVESCNIGSVSAQGGSGADAFAIENGEGILIVNSIIDGVSADGIDVKGKDVLVYGSIVKNINRNGVKLWQGGGILRSSISYTGADACLVTERGSLFIKGSDIHHHNYKGDRSYFCTFGYDERAVDLIYLEDCRFGYASGGIWIDPGANVEIENCAFWENENGVVLEHGSTEILIGDGDQQFIDNGWNGFIEKWTP